MAWAIVAVVLLIAVGVGWYVLQSTPTVSSSDGSSPSDSPKPIQRSEATRLQATREEVASCAAAAARDPSINVSVCVSDKIRARIATMGAR